MIEETFGLNSAPFRLGTDARFYFESEAHRRAMAHLRYGLRLAEGFVVITGEPGVGKTMLIEQLLLDLEGSDVIAAAIQPTGLTAENLARRVLGAFGRAAGTDDPAEALKDVLVMERERGAKASIIIDEAQHLSDEVLEALRLLLNLSHEGEALLQVCLLGQTGLRRVLFRPDMEQFRQRVVASHHLPALGAQDTEAYIRHRMRKAGRAEGEELFTDAACVAVFDATGGVPRRINALCGQILMQAALDGAEEIDAERVRTVAREAAQSGPAADAPATDAPGEEERVAVTPVPEPEAEPSAPESRTAANDDEEAAAERALALVTARTNGVDAEPEPEPETKSDEEAATADAEADATPVSVEPAASDEAEIVRPMRYASQVNGGGAVGQYPVSVGEINAAIRSIQTDSRPAVAAEDGAKPKTGERKAPAPRRRFRSPQELMLAKAKPPEADTPATEAPTDPVPAAADAEPAVPEAETPPAVAPLDRAALDEFLSEVGPAITELRAALDVLRARTDAMDERRRSRRDRLAEGADAAAARLAKLRGE